MTQFLERNKILNDTNLLADRYHGFIAFIQNKSQHARQMQNDLLCFSCFVNCLGIQRVKRIEQKMRVHLRFQEIQLRYFLLCLQLLVRLAKLDFIFHKLDRNRHANHRHVSKYLTDDQRKVKNIEWTWWRYAEQWIYNKVDVVTHSYSEKK